MINEARSYHLKSIDDAYRIRTKISETENSIIFEAEDTTGASVTCKLLKNDSPTPGEIARLKREYELIRRIDCAGVLNSYDIGELKGQPAIILEHFKGTTLKAIIPEKLGDYQWFLRVAMELAGILGELHQSNIVHQDIKPDNILINGDQVKITDFGISAEITHERREIYNPDLIEGTLPYMSPEQTGRINRAIDYRTDLYSLGVTFFEMLTGKRPFESDDPMEMIHFHIAKRPTPLSDINAQIPLAISDIVMKLLSKAAEDRYQNSFGLLADLQCCDEQIGRAHV
jgi:serine/threonine protein kinase